MNSITFVPYNPKKIEHLLFQEILLLDKEIQKEVPYLFGTTTMLICNHGTPVGALNTITAYDKAVLLEYGLLSEYRHQGIASHAIKEWVNQLFHTTDTRTIILSIAQTNEPSIRLARSLGFSFDSQLSSMMIEESSAPAYTLKKEL